MKHESCEGCRTNEIMDKCSYLNDSLDCPCATCLVKGMCNQECDLLEKHIDNVCKERKITQDCYTIGDTVNILMEVIQERKGD